MIGSADQHHRLRDPRGRRRRDRDRGCTVLTRSAADVVRQVLAGDGERRRRARRACPRRRPCRRRGRRPGRLDEPVGVRDHRCGADDDHRTAGVDDLVEQAEQVLDVGEAQGPGRSAQDVDPLLPSERPSLSRCCSPPESVVSGWPIVRYPSPTSESCSQGTLVRGRHARVAVGEVSPSATASPAPGRRPCR